MIGTRASATLWRVTHQHRTRPKDSPAPQGASAPEVVQTDELIVTSDPTGQDVPEVARLLVCGPNPEPWREHTILSVARAGEVRGLVATETASLRLPVNEAGAAVLQATESHRAEIGRLSHALALAGARIRDLEAQLEKTSAPAGAEPTTPASLETP